MICCLDPRVLDPAFAGSAYDDAFLASLPPSVDPCGERGEFHSFVYGGPGFSSELPITVGASVQRECFLSTDLTLA